MTTRQCSFAAEPEYGFHQHGFLESNSSKTACVTESLRSTIAIRKRSQLQLCRVNTVSNEIPDQQISHSELNQNNHSIEERSKIALLTHSTPFLTSLILHVILLALFSAIVLPALRSGSRISTVMETQFTEPSTVEISTEASGVTGSSEEKSVANVSSSKAITQVSSNAQELNSDLSFTEATTVINSSTPADIQISRSDLTTPIAVPMKYMPMYEHRGEVRISEVAGTSEIASGLSGDLVEIADDGDAIVVWLLDQSLSMQKDMKALAEDLLTTFKKIEDDESTKMLHYVVAFGDDVRVMQEATNKSYVAAKAIYKLPPDPSGIENTFQAVEWCVDNLFNDRKWKRFQERQKLLVVWTDESGDDYLRLENTIQKCLQSNVRVDVIGPSAVLGAQTGYSAYQSPENGLVYQLPVHRGPDSSFPQKLNLTYWYRNVPSTYDEKLRGPYSGLNPAWQGGSNLLSMLSGFSPYALSRLTKQTGGRFTIFDRFADRAPFRLETVREYLPDYRSTMEIRQDLAQQPFRQIILAASAATWQSNRIGTREPNLKFIPQIWGANSLQYQSVDLPKRVLPELNFAKQSLVDVERALSIYLSAATFPGFDPATEPPTRTTKNASPANRESDEVESTDEILDRQSDKLQISMLEKLYKEEPSPRWRAWCDLNFGRLLAASVRLREFIITTSPLTVKKTNGLGADTNYVYLQQSPVLRGGAVSTQRLQLATKLLTRCAEEHAGTPWAVMAERELRDHCGFELIQQVVPRPKPNLNPTRPVPNQKQPTLPNL